MPAKTVFNCLKKNINYLFCVSKIRVNEVFILIY